MLFHEVTNQILELLIDNKCWYERFEHAPVRTSEEAAQLRTGYTLNQGAKSMVLQIKKRDTIKEFIMVVLPGDLRMDSAKIKKLLDIKEMRFATEDEILKITDGIQIGGVPPFGILFGLRVIADPKIFNNTKIIFNAGDRCVSLAMLSEDYKKLVNPTIADITL